jgi:hypothetical protein
LAFDDLEKLHWYYGLFPETYAHDVGESETLAIKVVEVGLEYE